MLTLPNTTLTTGQRLSARLSWSDTTLGPWFSMYYIDGMRWIRLARGHLKGPVELWLRLLSEPRLTLDAGGADALGTVLFADTNLEKLCDALRNGLRRFAATSQDPAQVLPIYASVDRPFVIERWSWVLFGALSQMGSEAARAELVTFPAAAWKRFPDSDSIRLPVDLVCPSDWTSAIEVVAREVHRFVGRSSRSR